MLKPCKLSNRDSALQETKFPCFSDLKFEKLVGSSRGGEHSSHKCMNLSVSDLDVQGHVSMFHLK